MIEHLARPSFTPRQVLDDCSLIAQQYDSRTVKTLVDAANYLTRVLTKPDPMLGRPGAVCPFVGSALLDDMITLSILPLHTADAAMLRHAALAAKDDFPPARSPASSRAEALRAVIILLPHLDAADSAPMIEAVQKVLKPEMVERGLMIGEFFPGCTAPGLNNPNFRPADTDFAFLAIRRMTAGDLPFLIDDLAFVESYLDRFGDEGRRRLDKLRPAPRTHPGTAELQVGIVARSALSGSPEPLSIPAG